MKLVILESPYAGDIDRNVRYARRALLDCLRRNEAPIASHLLFTQLDVLDDSIAQQRKLGMLAGHAWYRVADLCVVYEDYGISAGMIEGLEVAQSWQLPIEVRKIGENS